jgi:hypothetical protein
MAEQQIVAMGGGGTSDAVVAEVFALAGRERPQVLYVGTASAEDPRNTLIMYDRARDWAQMVDFVDEAVEYSFDPGTNVVDVCIARLRHKLGGSCIETVRNVGYCLVAA